MLRISATTDSIARTEEIHAATTVTRTKVMLRVRGSGIDVSLPSGYDGTGAFVVKALQLKQMRCQAHPMKLVGREFVV